MVWVKFLICVVIVVIAGTRLSKYADVIAEKSGLGRAWVGLVLLAVATSLPELITGVSSVALVKVPDLTMGDLFGSNVFNLAIIAVMDILYRDRPLLSVASHHLVLAASLSMFAIAFAGAAIYTATSVSGLSFLGWIGFYSPVLILLYLFAQRVIFSFERSQQAELATTIEEVRQYEHLSPTKAYLFYGIAALFIIIAAIWLAYIGDEIAEVTGLGATLVGSLFLALTTSLPEVVVSISALRLGAVDMAVGNMFGSNLFNMGIIIAVDDLFYRGPILSHVSPNHILTALIAVLMTCVVIIALVYRTERKTFIGTGWDAIALIILFVGYYVLFIMGPRLG